MTNYIKVLTSLAGDLDERLGTLARYNPPALRTSRGYCNCLDRLAGTLSRYGNCRRTLMQDIFAGHSNSLIVSGAKHQVPDSLSA